MLKATVPTCARCGGELQPAPQATRVQCQYCGTVSELARHATAPQPLPGARAGSAGKNASAQVYLWAGVALLGSLGVSGLMAAQRGLSGGSSTVSPSAVVRALGVPAAIAERASTNPDDVPIQASDLAAVDPAALIQQASVEVRKRASNCELTYGYIGEQLHGGVFDATGNGALLEWGCRSVDKSKPPGQDVADDEWDVRVSKGMLELRRSGVASHNKPPWVEPSCPFSRAWAAAVASGVPDNAAVRVYYRGDSNAKMAWDLDVKGHPEFARKVDGATCQVVR